MPTSSGFDRTNYGTTLNFSRHGGPGGNYHQYHHQSQPISKNNGNMSFASSSDVNNTNQNGSNQMKFFSTARNSQSYKQHYKAAKTMKAASVGSSPNIPAMEGNGNVMPHDSLSVNIKDPNLRELVQKLVKINEGI